MRAAVSLALDYLDGDDDRRLESLAGSLDDEEPGGRGRLLAQICRAAAEALRNQPDRAWTILASLDQSPAYLEPGLAALVLEIVDLASSSPGGESGSTPWANLRGDLNESLKIGNLGLGDRFDSNRPPPPFRP